MPCLNTSLESEAPMVKWYYGESVVMPGYGVNYRQCRCYLVAVMPAGLLAHQGSQANKAQQVLRSWLT